MCYSLIFLGRRVSMHISKKKLVLQNSLGISAQGRMKSSTIRQWNKVGNPQPIDVAGAGMTLQNC